MLTYVGGSPHYAEQGHGIVIILVAIKLITEPVVVVGRPPFPACFDALIDVLFVSIAFVDVLGHHCIQ